MVNIVWSSMCEKGIKRVEILGFSSTIATIWFMEKQIILLHNSSFLDYLFGKYMTPFWKHQNVWGLLRWACCNK